MVAINTVGLSLKASIGLAAFGASPKCNFPGCSFPCWYLDSEHYPKIVSQTQVGQCSELFSVSSLPSRWNSDTWLGAQTLPHWLGGLLQPLAPLPPAQSLCLRPPGSWLAPHRPWTLLLGRSPFPRHLVTAPVCKARPSSFFLVACPLSLPVPVHSHFSQELWLHVEGLSLTGAEIRPCGFPYVCAIYVRFPFQGQRLCQMSLYPWCLVKFLAYGKYLVNVL